ncbi:MAG TPA: hypothetical protein VJ901_12395 [Thermoanaerobaculia bacterium]|nr:hypothetical protein [Thermoanaerobaculia bacterium]
MQRKEAAAGYLTYQENTRQFVTPQQAGESVGLQAPVEFTDGCNDVRQALSLSPPASWRACRTPPVAIIWC